MVLNEESKAVLEACPQKDNEILYWLAWLHRDDNNAEEFLKKADNGDAYMTFPFRPETATVMEWAITKTPDWKCRYYLALIDAFRGHTSKALQLLEDGKAPEDFAPFYVLRSRLRDSSDVTSIQSDLIQSTAD